MFWAHVAKFFEKAIINHQGFAVLIEKEPYLRTGSRISEQERIFHDLIEVEEFDGFQRPPYLKLPFPLTRSSAFEYWGVTER